MGRPVYRDTQTMPLYSKQKYSFPGSPVLINEWGRVMEILCEDLAFHELLAKHQMSAVINPDWSIRFRNDGGKITGPRYSRVMKAMWDQYHATFQDYGIQLQNNYTGQLV